MKQGLGGMNGLGVADMFSGVMPSMNVQTNNSDGNYKDISIDDLIPFKDHPFRVDNDNNFESLKMSISEIGVRERILVRKSAENGKYEVISGHRRLEACRELSLSTVPCEIVDVDDNVADIMMVDCNQHRSKLLPSEISKALFIKNKALKNYRITMGEKKDRYTKENLSETFGLSERTVFNYISLQKLIPEFMDMADSGKLNITIGFFLAQNFEKDAQQIIYNFHCDTQKFPDSSQLKRLLTVITENKEADVYKELNKIIFSEVASKRKISFDDKQLSEYFSPNDSEEYMQDVVQKLLKGWHEGKYQLEDEE